MVYGKKRKIVTPEVFYGDEFPNELPKDDPIINKPKYERPENYER